ncbi:hypothetical protein Tel_04510 [Candidatus Tenderia electrophaga]|jgi:hypothetical protein|uniref:Peptidase n=1 Tax=Candidatus Tenderia electrophaga TaxID=1748243 RepID=A0A0S2TBJ8_9GAMM|nr:hypothetical protein Tel_04510 [Candidatus Tenderia electrophaga]
MPTEAQVIAAARCWVEQVVLKHNFCPFAHKPVRNNALRYVVSQAGDTDRLVQDLIDELLLLRDADHGRTATTLLVTPDCLREFDAYNRFLDLVDVLIAQFNLQGVIQVASFHPDYQFADLDPDDVRNYTNRTPFPMFHLILEADIERARADYPDVGRIPEDNMRLLQRLGLEAARRQLAACRDAPGEA